MSTAWVKKPAILSKIPLDRHAIIEASAGTGKTFTLESLIAELVLAGHPVSSLLVVTFTEKATTELRRRVREKLASLARAEAPTEAPGDEPGWTIDEAARERLSTALAELDSATISTIHGFCQRVLTEHAFFNQRLFREAPIDGQQVFARVFTRMVRTHLARDSELSGYLEAWLRSGRGLDDLLDGLWQCHRFGKANLRPNYAPDRLKEVLRAFPVELVDPQVLLTKRSGGRSRTSARQGAALPTLLAAVERARGPGRLVDFLVELDGLEESCPGLIEELREAASERPYLAPLADAVAELQEAAPPLEAAILSRFLPLVAEEVDREKRESGGFDFDDMLSLLERALTHGPAAELLTEALRRRYRYGLIDEFQDTDPVQWRIFRRIFFEGRSSGLFVIGDPKQAIYGFRGADVHTYLTARTEVLAAGGVKVSLTECYRATPRLIGAYNQILERGAPEALFAGPIDYDAPVTAGRPSLKLVDASGREPAAVHFLRVEARPGESPGVAEIREILAQRIALEIERILDPRHQLFLSDPGQPDRPEVPVTASEIHVLTRTSYEGSVIGQALRARRIPHAFFKQDGLFQTAEAMAIRDLLEAVADPDSRPRRFRAWLTPFFDVPLEDLPRLAEVSSAHPLLRNLYEWRAIAEGRDYGLLFHRIVEDSGVVRRDLFFRRGERALTNYLHLFEVLLGIAVHERPELSELVRRLSAMIDGRTALTGENPNVQRLETERDAVQVMTIHKAKGLEAAVVFVFGGYWPSPNDRPPHRHHLGGELALELAPRRRLSSAVLAAVAKEEDEEVQRLLYVALTRAKGRLYLPLVDSKKIRGDYLRLNRRLEHLAREGLSSEAGRFSEEPVPVGASRFLLVEPSDKKGQEPSSPPAKPSEPVPNSDTFVHPLDHQGFTITSYSRMKAQAEGRGAGSDAVDDLLAEDDPPPLELQPDDLPPGTASGILVHELLERVPLSSFQGQPDLSGWLAQPEIDALLRGCLSAHGLDERHLLAAGRLVHRGFGTPVVLGDAQLSGLGQAEQIAREMEFVYPMPEAWHRPLGAPVATERQPPVTIGRGYVKGFVDLAFLHKGRVYFADWKSDLLPDYQAASLARTVEESYFLQIKVYSLAFARLLGITSERAHQARFGGAVYLFLRGLSATGEGLFFYRPSWQEILAFEQELVRGEVTTSLKKPAPAAWQRTFGFAGMPDETPSGRGRSKRGRS